MPLLQDDKDSEDEEAYEFEESQEFVAKLMHLIYHKSNHDLYFEILMKFKRVFVKGGLKRMKYTIPALIFSLFRLSNEMLNESHDDHEHDQEETKEAADEGPQVKL